MSKFNINVIVNYDQKQINFDINKNLHIPSIDLLTPARLANMMAENSSTLARWNVLANRAWHDYEILKMRFEIWEKSEHKRCRESLLTESKRKMTERMIDEAVMSDPEYSRRFEALLDAQENAENVRSIARSFANQGERLVNISSLMKVEINRTSASVSSRPERENAGESKSRLAREDRAFGSNEDSEDDVDEE